jgi:hypothetical protein
MLRKKKKALKGPSWIEVILGAILSVMLGVVLGAALLVTKTVSNVTSIPKDAPSGAVYYIEGRKDMNRLEVLGKRKAFVAGESVDVTEGELNALLASSGKPSSSGAAKTKPGDKPPEPADVKMIDPSTLNVRIRDGRIQFSDTVTLSALGVTTSVIVQASGVFTRTGSGYEFDPDVIYVGGCPAQRLLIVRSMILKKLLFTEPVPDDVAAAWSKLVDVSIDGTRLRMKAP